MREGLLIVWAVVLAVSRGQADPAESGGSVPTEIKEWYSSNDPAHLAIRQHSFVFVAGPHHSGTTLMNLLVSKSNETTGLSNTDVPQNEGQHLQTVYPKAYQLGGMLGYALHPESHMTEASEKCSGVNAATLYSSWAEYWNLSKPVLVEKTPNHMVMTRFLQCLFSPQRAKFVITIRHPFGATHFKWKLPKQIDNVKRHCGRPWIKNWLRQMTVLKEDLPYLAHARIVIFENFTTGDVQQNYEDMMGSIDIKPTMKITVQKRPPRVSFDHMKKHHERRTQLGSKQQIDEGDAPRKTRLGRKLLGFVGDPSNLVLYTEKWFAWVDAWKERYGDLFESRVCQAVFDDFEDKVAEFGYSLRNPERVTQPRAFSASMVLPRS